MLRYLASPYTHVEPGIMRLRADLALEAASAMMRLYSWHVYSPIAYCHPMAERWDMPRDHEWWQEFNQRMIDLSGEVRVLCIYGWEESAGVQAEIAYAEMIGKPVVYDEPSTWISLNELLPVDNKIISTILSFLQRAIHYRSPGKQLSTLLND